MFRQTVCNILYGSIGLEAGLNSRLKAVKGEGGKLRALKRRPSLNRINIQHFMYGPLKAFHGKGKTDNPLERFGGINFKCYFRVGLLTIPIHPISTFPCLLYRFVFIITIDRSRYAHRNSLRLNITSL